MGPFFLLILTSTLLKPGMRFYTPLRGLRGIRLPISPRLFLESLLCIKFFSIATKSAAFWFLKYFCSDRRSKFSWNFCLPSSLTLHLASSLFLQSRGAVLCLITYLMMMWSEQLSWSVTLLRSLPFVTVMSMLLAPRGLRKVVCWLSSFNIYSWCFRRNSSTILPLLLVMTSCHKRIGSYCLSPLVRLHLLRAELFFQSSAGHYLCVG